MLSSGLRHHRVRIERRASVEDGYGNTRAEWAPVVERWAAVKLPPRGAEGAEAGGLETAENWSVTVLRDAETRGVLAEDRVIVSSGAHAGRVGAVVAVRATNDGREMHIDVQIGAAT